MTAARSARACSTRRQDGSDSDSDFDDSAIDVGGDFGDDGGSDTA